MGISHAIFRFCVHIKRKEKTPESPGNKGFRRFSSGVLASRGRKCPILYRENVQFLTGKNIVASYEVQGPTLEETQIFLNDRMKQAGGNPRIFAPRAIMAAHTASQGSLRRLGIILNTALIVGCSEGIREIGPEIIQKAVEEMAL